MATPQERTNALSSPRPQAQASSAQPPLESLSLEEMAASVVPRSGTDLVLRGLDILISGVVLVLALVPMALIALAIRVFEGAPVLYRGDRVGRYGHLFVMFKFRTLRPGSEERFGPALGDALLDRTAAEVTPIGRWLRPTQLDELPQLFNVLRGDMSLVGPRPFRPRFYEEFCETIPLFWQRLSVRPGLTGFAQLREDRVDAHRTPYAEKLAHDLEYVADRSLGLYLRAIGATAVRLVRQLFGALRRRDG